MRKIINLFIVLSLLDIVGAGLLWYGYLYIQSEKNKETELRVQISEESQKGQKLATLKRTLASANKDHQELVQFLIDPSEENQIQLISGIEKLGSSTAQISAETTSFELTATAPIALRGSLTLKGSWRRLYHFLRLIEEYPSRAMIDRLDISYSPSGPTPEGKKPLDIWSGSITITLSALKALPT